MLDDGLEWMRHEVRETVGMILDWRLHAGLGIVIAGAFVATRLGYSFGPGSMTLFMGAGMVIGISLRWLRLQERRERPARDQDKTEE